jgi:hypothetical protein
VTWGSSNTSVATISNVAQAQGGAIGFGPGTATLTATLGSITGTTGLTVVAASTTPTITSLSKVLVQIGIPITITGTNFGSSRGSSTVTFNGILATPTGWSDTGIATTVPPGATTGYVVVTVGGVQSNQELFAIVPPLPTITSLSQSSGAAGAPVTIYGSTFGAPQGTGTVTLNGLSAPVTGWGDSEVTINVPNNATSGALIVTAGGVPSDSEPFTVIGPAVTGLSVDAGAVGDSITVYGAGFGSTQSDSAIAFNGIAATPASWSDMTIVVPVPTGATTGPIAVAVAGVSSSSTTFTVGPPDTITGLSISSPANGASVGGPYAAVTGSITGVASGIDPVTVTCNSVSATLTTTNFSCNVPLVAGVNSITVTGADSAGDSQTATLSVTLAISSPISIQVTPPSPNMLVGATQTFTAVDDQGVERPDATWTVSDSTIANFVDGSPNTLMADAVGQVTVTATVGGASAQTSVTVLTGTTPPIGTVLWSGSLVPGFSTQQIVQAVPTADGPDFYAIDTGANGDTLVRALKSTGEQMWQHQISETQNVSPHGVGDNFGGLLLIGSSQNGGSPHGVITDLDRQSGAQAWQFSTSANNSIAFGAVGLDGSVYAIEGGSSLTYVDSINGVSGGLQQQTPLPASTSYFHCPGETYTRTGGSAPGPAVVAPDGSLYMEVTSSNTILQTNCEAGPQPYEFGSGTSNLSLLRISPDGGVGLTSLDSSSGPGLIPGKVIPDGQGGALASWAKGTNPTIADVGSSGSPQAIFSSLSGGVSGLVLGDNNKAFATDGNTVVGFGVPALAPAWTYSSTGGSLSFITSMSGGGVAVEDSLLGLVQIDSNGNASQPVAGFSSWGPWALGVWPLILNNVPAFVAGPDVLTSLSAFPQEEGGGAQNGQAPKPTIDHFMPKTADQYGQPTYGPFINGMKSYVSPKWVNHKFFTGHDASAKAFQVELAKPLAAIGFLGDSFFITGNSNIPNFSVGLAFQVDGTALVRPSLPTDNPQYSTNDSTLQVIDSPSFVTQARVVFVAACYIGPSFEQLWNINSGTIGQVLIVPSNPNSQILMGHAFTAWEELTFDMAVQGMTAQAAVNETNTFLATQHDNLGNPLNERYTFIGDGNVKLK